MRQTSPPILRLPTPTIGASALPLIAGTLETVGLDAAGAFAAAGLSVLAGPELAAAAIPLAAFTALLQRAGAQAPGSPQIWRCGRGIVEPALRQLFPESLGTRRLGELFDQVLADLQQLQAGTHFARRTEADTCLVTYRIIDPTIWPRSRDAEFTLAFLHGVLARIAGEAAAAEATLAFEHERDSGAEIAMVCGCQPLYGHPTNFLAFPARLLDMPVDADFRPSFRHHRAPDAPSETARASALGQPFERVVAEAIYMRLGQGALTQPAIAAECGVSERSLRRRLAERGVSFREAAEEARTAYALWALRETSLPVAEIAYRLGYDDQGAFARAFRRATGTSPSELRLAGAERKAAGTA
jgi:AraC-like DNA-binding protein